MSTPIKSIAEKAYKASFATAQLSSSLKSSLLNRLADLISEEKKSLIAANQKDLDNAEEKGLSSAMIDRLVLNDARLDSMAVALREIAQQEDPVGAYTESWIRPNGIQVKQMRIPLGVIAMIYESRPNVTTDAAALAIKSGNAIILRGGSEAFHSNLALIELIHKALTEFQIPTGAVSFLPTTDREAMLELLQQKEFVDLVIPRGGTGLIQFVTENSQIPVIQHFKGVCHLYVDHPSDLPAALDILVDGKVSRPGVCNALETLLIHKAVAPEFFNLISQCEAMKSVEFRGCPKSQALFPGIQAATEDDYAAEFLDKILAVKVVSDLDSAIKHIQQFTSNHTEVIVTQHIQHAETFIKALPSSVIMVNASSRFSDGGELGLGAEIGISTSKLHAFGPMGAKSLTTLKFVVTGNGQTRHGSLQ